MSEIYVGRQPIYTRDLDVYAYELLFRSGEANNATFDFSGDDATSQTIVNSFFEIGIEKIVGSRLAFINLTQSFLLEEDKLPITPKQAVLEVLEDIPVTGELVAAVKRLKSKGFVIALDDYIYNPAHKPLVELADIIKIDLMALNKVELQEHVRVLRQYQARLLAEKVETFTEYDMCMDMGFDYFQGYFLSKPRVIKASRLPQNKLAVLNILALLQNPESDIDDIDEAISSDVTMSYKILKLMNSALFNFRSKIESIRQALVMLGRKQLNSWASMTAMSKMDEQPPEMIRIAMIRAKMCEILADSAGFQPAESYFTVGLFSALDILMEQPLDALLSPLPLSSDITDAVLKHQGPMGEALACTLAYETSDTENIKFKNLTMDDIYVANVEAITWANMVMDLL